MSQNKENRVLSRLHGRELSAAEYEQVGAGFGTGVCTFNPKTGLFDRDCSPPPP